MAFYNPIFAFFALFLTLSVLGAFFGAFCAKLVYRLERGHFRGLSVFTPSFCPTCGKPIQFADKLPIVGYLRTRGHCRRCGSTISYRYLLFEVLGFCLPSILFYFENYTLNAFFDYFFIMIMLTGLYISLDSQNFPVSLSICLYILAGVYIFYNADLIEAFLGAAAGVLLSYATYFTLTSRKTINQYALLSGAVGLYFGLYKTIILFGLYLLLLLLERGFDALEKRSRIASGSLFSAAACIVALTGNLILMALERAIIFATS